MLKQELYNILNDKYMVLDGAVGTFLQKEGMPSGVCPEKWALENPSILSKIHKSYANSGSDIVYTCTFGANKLKLKTYGLENESRDFNRRLTALAKESVGNNVYVAGSIGPTGKFIEPVGDLAFDDALSIFSSQIQGMIEGGADLLVIETMMDIQEARAALLAAKAICGLPVIVSLTYADNNRTLTGTDPLTALVTLQSLGADIIGTNCGFGPDNMLNIVKTQSPYANVPLMAKPNAGLPMLKDNQTVYDMSPCEFGEYVPAFMAEGIRLMGGCCGTSPEYISTIKNHFDGKKPVITEKPFARAVTSRSKTVFFSNSTPPVIIGERINPTGKKVLSEELKQGKMTELKRLANEQANYGADILDVNVGAPSVDELPAMRQAVFELSGFTDLPLCIDSSNPEVIEEALKHYPGRALVNSLSAEKAKMDKLMPVLKKYGCMFVFLPIDDNGVPLNAKERLSIVQNAVDSLAGYGISPSDMIIDGLTMTVSSLPEAPKETLDTIYSCANTMNLLTTIGLSNVSFGLPERKWVNTSFLAMAIEKGLQTVIINPCDEITMNSFYASCVLCGKDQNSLTYIKYIQKSAGLKGQAVAQKSENIDCRYCLIHGDKDTLRIKLEEEINSGRTALSIVNDLLVPAMGEVGDKFNRREFFLPQLMLSAEAMRSAFAYLHPYLQKGASHIIGRMIIATVKGDIHDIGKNMVALMLRNHGIEVLDLGKDVSLEEIMRTAQKENISVIGLSALMTTTMTEMENIIKYAKDNGFNYKFVVGGAVITPEYAEKIGAHAYAKDSVEAVTAVKSLL